MEKFLLHSVFSCNSLDIVYQQEVSVAVFFMKSYGIFKFERLYKLIDKGFTCGVDYLHLRIFLLYLMLDSFHKVSLAQSGIAVDDKWIKHLIRVYIL